MNREKERKLYLLYFSGGYEIPAKRTGKFIKPTANEISVHRQWNWTWKNSTEAKEVKASGAIALAIILSGMVAAKKIFTHFYRLL